MKRQGAVTVVVLGLAAAVLAREAQQLEDMVVTSSKAPKSKGNVTQQIDVLSQADIAGLVLGNRNLAEALTYLPGNAVTVLSRSDANWGSYGGIGPKYSTWMLSGLPIDAFVDPQALDAWAFERIEAQRGPASVLYPNYLSQDFAGNQSPLAGTVNLILRDRIDGPAARAAIEYGSYRTFAGRLYFQNRYDQVHVFGGVSYEDSDYENYGTPDSWLNMIDDPGYEKTKTYIGVTRDFREDGSHSLSVFANWAGHEGDTGRPHRGFDHEYALINAAYNLPLRDQLTAQAKVGYRRYDRSWEDDNFFNGEDLSLASDNGVEQGIIPADLAFSLTHNEHNLLTFGADFQFADYETHTTPVGGAKMIGNESDSTQYGIYVQEEVVVDEDLILRVGGRFNNTEHDIDLLSGAVPGNDSESWDEFLWSAGARYNAGNGVSPFVNVGSSFLAPSLKSAGGTLNIADRGVPGRNGQLPNPGLEAEEGLGGDLGVDFQACEDLSLTVRAFLNNIDDAIVENVVSENPSQSQSVNAGETTSYGVEVGLRHRVTENVAWFANYTYTDSEVDNNVDPDQDGAEIPFVPENAANVGVEVSLPRDMRLDATLHYAGEIYDSTSKSNRRRFDSYEVLNVKLRKVLLAQSDYRLDLYVEVYNILNNEFEMPWQFQDPGTSGTAGLLATF